MMTVSGGKRGWTADKMPVLGLTTTGHKSGQQRSTRQMTARTVTGDEHSELWDTITSKYKNYAD
jgi:hypothetical protein